jgi:hypothetical protein
MYTLCLTEELARGSLEKVMKAVLAENKTAGLYDIGEARVLGMGGAELFSGTTSFLDPLGSARPERFVAYTQIGNSDQYVAFNCRIR